MLKRDLPRIILQALLSKNRSKLRRMAFSEKTNNILPNFGGKLEAKFFKIYKAFQSTDQLFVYIHIGGTFLLIVHLVSMEKVT